MLAKLAIMDKQLNSSTALESDLGIVMNAMVAVKMTVDWN